MNAKQLLQLGVPVGEPLRLAFEWISAFCRAGGDKAELAPRISAIIANPSSFQNDPLAGPFAKALLVPDRTLREPVPYHRWGEEIDQGALDQMENARVLPVSVAAALMPDAHIGYGLPIGGVLATENAVIPYAVGVDIACRMKMTVLDLPLDRLDRDQDRLRQAIEQETRFGVGVSFQHHRREHEVMDEDWSVSPVTREKKDKAWGQLGTSGSGNHFVEFGIFTSLDDSVGLPKGEYVALLSHSGSRGTGAKVCDHYSKLATQRHPELPRELQRLAWLSLDGSEGQEYWAAMQLMGRYASANHALIHHHVAKNLGLQVLLDLENHHNFAWKEQHLGREVVVHRKGATPAGQGVFGIIPGSMATPGFVVRGKGNADSLHSAAHGAGRCMSRTQATRTLSWKDATAWLHERGVTLISAGLDEVPMVYKDIHKVMAAQADLVEVLGRFDPRLVKMCPSGERPED